MYDSRYNVETSLDLSCENFMKVNIYRPVMNNSTKPLPIAIFIHGGAFYFGNAAMIGSHLAKEGLIVVVIQYTRSGIHMGCEHCNLSLLDFSQRGFFYYSRAASGTNACRRDDYFCVRGTRRYVTPAT